MTDSHAYILRENTGTPGIKITARAAVEALAHFDSWSNSPTIRIRDKADVVELISRRNLSRSLSLHSAVQHLYTEIWDALQAEGPTSHPV